MNKCWNGESEHGNIDSKGDAFFIDHFVVTLHGAQRRFNNGAAGVLVLFSGRDVRLHANHTFALYFGFAAMTIGYQPITPNNCTGARPKLRMVTVYANT